LHLKVRSANLTAEGSEACRDSASANPVAEAFMGTALGNLTAAPGASRDMASANPMAEVSTGKALANITVAASGASMGTALADPMAEASEAFMAAAVFIVNDHRGSPASLAASSIKKEANRAVQESWAGRRAGMLSSWASVVSHRLSGQNVW
jgi:hypothetical protein